MAAILFVPAWVNPPMGGLRVRHALTSYIVITELHANAHVTCIWFSSPGLHDPTAHGSILRIIAPVQKTPAGEDEFAESHAHSDWSMRK